MCIRDSHLSSAWTPLENSARAPLESSAELHVSSVRELPARSATAPRANGTRRPGSYQSWPAASRTYG
eukprot:6563587-Alexandrium_andersonii.AAC.1